MRFCPPDFGVFSVQKLDFEMDMMDIKNLAANDIIETPARVQKIEDHWAWVETRPHRACANCDPEHGCRSLAMARLFSQKLGVFRVENTLQCRAGDEVIIAISARVLRQSALWAYVMPLLALLLGASLGAIWSESASIIGGIFGLAMALFSLKSLEKRWQKPEFSAQMLRQNHDNRPSCSAAKPH